MSNPVDLRADAYVNDDVDVEDDVIELANDALDEAFEAFDKALNKGITSDI